MALFEHHRRSLRYHAHDYRRGTYFVTVCTQNRERIFGEIRNGIMGLSDVGCIVVEELLRTETIRPYVHIDTWVVMPNHVHVLLQMDHRATDVRATRRVAPTPTTSPLPESLGAVIAQWKSICTKRINARRDALPSTRVWHRNYYDRFIRSDIELESIQTYIRNNPTNWPTDPENL